MRNGLCKVFIGLGFKVQGGVAGLIHAHDLALVGYCPLSVPVGEYLNVFI